ncbi:exosome 3'-_5 exonuclease subunit ski4 (Csl4) [Lambiella insularis]|nr:exosome 3'->5 exonuclease subunit ski4 (Csl4) [Lambiella insularis]
MLPQIAYPGLVLGPASQYTPGPGTHVYEGQVYASLAGPVVTTAADPIQPVFQKTAANKFQPTSLPQLSVTRPAPPTSIPSHLVSATNVLPAVNDIVLAKVTRLQTRQVTVAILVVEETVCADSFVGVIRREDVRGWEIDRVVVGEGFRVGDVVRAVVISLGDQSSYYLSTARNELGVIMATSEDGNTMYPISWKEFRDPVTGRAESRKVAKPF